MSLSQPNEKLQPQLARLHLASFGHYIHIQHYDCGCIKSTLLLQVYRDILHYHHSCQKLECRCKRCLVLTAKVFCVNRFLLVGFRQDHTKVILHNKPRHLDELCQWCLGSPGYREINYLKEKYYKKVLVDILIK